MHSLKENNFIGTARVNNYYWCYYSINIIFTIRSIIFKDYEGFKQPQRKLYEKIPIESFWCTFKNGLVYHCDYQTREEAIIAIIDCYKDFLQQAKNRIQETMPLLPRIATFLMPFS